MFGSLNEATGLPDAVLAIGYTVVGGFVCLVVEAAEAEPNTSAALEIVVEDNVGTQLTDLDALEERDHEESGK